MEPSGELGGCAEAELSNNNKLFLFSLAGVCGHNNNRGALFEDQKAIIIEYINRMVDICNHISSALCSHVAALYGHPITCTCV